MRKLPIYLLIDTSDSLRGEPIESVRNGLRMLVSVLRKDPQALETAYLSIITFGGTAEQILPLTELAEFEIPEFEVGGGRMLGAALNLVCDCWKSEIDHRTEDQKGDFCPIVFILTDGVPADDTKDAVDRFRGIHWGAAVSCAAGPAVDKGLLDKITPGCVVELATSDQASLLSCFKWETERSSESMPKEHELSVRKWTGEYFKCQSCGEIYAYTLCHCPHCGGECLMIGNLKRS